MPRYEYKVVPAPTKGLKGKGIKGAEARFSHALQELMNGLSGYGWEYQRAETLPSLERVGLTSTTTEWRNVLVFRRLRENDAENFAPELLPAPGHRMSTAPEETEIKEEQKGAASREAIEASADADDHPAEAAARRPAKAPDAPWDNGVEDTTDVKGITNSLTRFAQARKSRNPEA